MLTLWGRFFIMRGRERDEALERSLIGLTCKSLKRTDLKEGEGLLVMAEQDVGAGARAIFEEAGIQLAEGLTPAFWEEADGLILSGHEPLPAVFYDNPGRVKVVASLAANTATLPMERLTRAGLPVLRPRHLETDSAADFVMWRMLENARNRAGGGMELKDKTIGFLGFGGLAAYIARRAQSFGMHCCCFDPDVSEARARGFGCTMINRVDLMIVSDFICVTLPLDATTTGIIGKDEIQLMKTDATLIHMADPQVLRWNELCRALDWGYLQHFIIDLPADASHLAKDLHGFPQAHVTVNEAGNTREAFLGNVRELAADMLRIARGEEALTAVNIPKRRARKIRNAHLWLELSGILGQLMGQRLTKLPRQGSLNAEGPAQEIGSAVLLAAALEGVALGFGQAQVNTINSRMWAEEQGLKMQVRGQADTEPPELVLSMQTGRGVLRMAGRINHGEITITQVDDYLLTAKPTEHILLIPHINRPGMIGLAGTMLGEWGININGMVLGHKATERATALMWIVLGKKLSEEMLARIRALPNMDGAEYMQLMQRDMKGDSHAGY